MGSTLPSKQELMSIFKSLRSAYGDTYWWPSKFFDDKQFEIICGAILTQNTSWRNVEKALARMSVNNVSDWNIIQTIDVNALEDIIRPSGYFRVKAKKLKAFAQAITESGGSIETFLPSSMQTEDLRSRLLAIFGIGPETADAILVYAMQKPSFIIDKYTIRIAQRLGWQPKDNKYNTWKQLFEENLKPDVALYNEYHALLDRHASRVCLVKPKCAECCIVNKCIFVKCQ